MISTNKQTYMLMKQRKTTTTKLLKPLRNAWLLGPISSNTNNGDDDADDGEPTNVVLSTPGGH